MKNFKTMAQVRRFAVYGAMVAGALITSTAAIAGGSAKIAISATVLGRASLQVLAQPAGVVVTPADIARGYVDIPVPAHVAIQTNSRTGYVLDFASQGDFVRQILVRGLANDVQLSPSGGTVVQTTSGATRATLALGFRFMLAETTQQGIYPWPVRLSVTAL